MDGAILRTFLNLICAILMSFAWLDDNIKMSYVRVPTGPSMRILFKT